MRTPLNISTAVLKRWFFRVPCSSSPFPCNIFDVAIAAAVQHARFENTFLPEPALFILVVNVSSRVEIMAAPRSRKWKADGQLSIRIVFFFQGNQVRKRPGVRGSEWGSEEIWEKNLFVGHRWCWWAQECYWGLGASVFLHCCECDSEWTMTCRARNGIHLLSARSRDEKFSLFLSFSPWNTITRLASWITPNNSLSYFWLVGAEVKKITIILNVFVS